MGTDTSDRHLSRCYVFDCWALGLDPQGLLCRIILAEPDCKTMHFAQAYRAETEGFGIMLTLLVV